MLEYAIFILHNIPPSTTPFIPQSSHKYRLFLSRLLIIQKSPTLLPLRLLPIRSLYTVSLSSLPFASPPSCIKLTHCFLQSLYALSTSSAFTSYFIQTLPSIHSPLPASLQIDLLTENNHGTSPYYSHSDASTSDSSSPPPGTGQSIRCMLFYFWSTHTLTTCCPNGPLCMLE